jgi:hypothetical protein
MSNGITQGNMLGSYIIQATLSPAEVAINTTAEQAFTIPGLKTGDFVSVMKPTAQAGLGIVGTRVTAANTIGITFANVTGSAITPTASQVYIINVTRPANNAAATGIID